MDHPVTIILGLGREVGQAVARRFFELGHNVVAADGDRERTDRAEKDLPDKIRVLHTDTSEPLGLRNCFNIAEEAFERIDNLIVIPRIAPDDALAEIDTDDFAETISRATGGAMLAAKLFAERLAEREDAVIARAEQARQRGTVTFILSETVSASQPGRFTATATQGAVEAVMRAASLELAPQEIRVNAIAAVRPRAEEDDWIGQRTPLGRAALSDEIAEAALYLSSQGAAIITGETLVLDGGRARLTGLI